MTDKTRRPTTDALRVNPPSGRNENDAYYTPPELTRALLGLCDIDPDWVIGEPCCGDGWITRELQAAGLTVRSSDITSNVDFFGPKAEALHGGSDFIITNPPYNGAARFVRRALEMAPRVAMLLRVTFLEPCETSPDSARLDLLRRLSRVIVLPRTSFIHGKGGSDSATSAWFIWDENDFNRWGLDMEDDRPTGPASITWVSKRELAELAGQETLFGGPE